MGGHLGLRICWLWLELGFGKLPVAITLALAAAAVTVASAAATITAASIAVAAAVVAPSRVRPAGGVRRLAERDAVADQPRVGLWRPPPKRQLWP